jgi:hypothetical protein
MPFPRIYGVPSSTSVELRHSIRADLILALSKAADIPAGIIRPFFVPDLVGDPDPGQDTTIFCALDSGMFGDKSENERKKATSAITEVIWRGFRGKYEVETMIHDIDFTGKTLRHPALTTFVYDGIRQNVEWVETDDQVAPGVLCDVYRFGGDNTKDLALIMIEPGCKTPRQLVRKGEYTFEGYVSGKGTLIVDRKILNGFEVTTYTNIELANSTAVVNIGDIMHWEADPDSPLVAYEICYPPYKDGRYENLS